MERKYTVTIKNQTYSIREVECRNCGNDLLIMLEPPANPGMLVPYCGECRSFVNGCIRPIHRGRRKRTSNDAEALQLQGSP